MTLIMTFDIEDDLGSSILFQKWILEIQIIWKGGITLLSMHICSSYFLCLRFANYMLISYYANKNVPHGCHRGNQARSSSIYL